MQTTGKRPKLLLVGSALGGGGAETRFRLLAQHLFGGTADVAVLLEQQATLGGSQNLHHLGWNGPRSYPKLLRRLRRVLRETPFDAVLSLGLYPNTLASLALVGMRRPPALIMTEITQPDTEGRLGGPVRHAISHMTRRVTYPFADLCGANSEDGVAEVLRYYRVDPARIRRLPNLVEPERLDRLAAEPEPEDEDGVPTICAVSRLDPLKRIDTLVEAVAVLPDDLAWRVDIIGDGPDRAALEALVTRIGVRARVRFHGWKKNPYPFMKRAKVTALTSAYEGFSNTVLESMTLGTPVVTSFCSTDARQMVERGAALGFAVGDVTALSGHLARLLRDEALRRDIAMTARRYASRHDIANALPEYEALISEAVAARVGRR